jgi:acyl-CoA synthetase (NDP forming)
LSDNATEAGNDRVTEFFAAARGAGRHLLSEVEAKAALGAAGLPVTPTRLATSAAEAVAIAGELGYPVVLKVVSDTVTHKSDVGGVELSLADAAAVEAAYARIEAAVTEAAGAEAFGGVSVQPMAAPGTEVIIGMTQDPQFGPVLMFGLGGVLVEVLKDVAFRVVPLEPHDAAEMIREIQAFPVLEGYRGAPPADLAALEAILLALSAFAAAHPEVQELDLNPILARHDGATAVDARIVLTPA